METKNSNARNYVSMIFDSPTSYMDYSQVLLNIWTKEGHHEPDLSLVTETIQRLPNILTRSNFLQGIKFSSQGKYAHILSFLKVFSSYVLVEGFKKGRQGRLTRSLCLDSIREDLFKNLYFLY